MPFVYRLLRFPVVLVDCLLYIRAQSLRLQLFATPWTAAHWAPLSMEFSRQEYWNGLPFPSPGDFPDPGIKPTSPASKMVSYIAGVCFTSEP